MKLITSIQVAVLLLVSVPGFSATSITVQDWDFELNNLSANWNPAGFVTYDPSTYGLYSGPIPSESYAAGNYTAAGGSISQQTGHDFTAGETYDLSAWVGLRDDDALNASYPNSQFKPDSELRLFAGDSLESKTLLKSVVFANPGIGLWGLNSLTFGPGDANYSSPDVVAVLDKTLIVQIYVPGRENLPVDDPDYNPFWENDYDNVQLTYDLASLLGDMNGDGDVDGYDITPFVTALTNRTQYLIDFPLIDADVVGDCNQLGDGLDGYDITPFVALITGAGSPVPEPATLALLGVGVAALLRGRRRFGA